MKKYFVFAAAALVALASCTKIDNEIPAKDQKITFDVVKYAQQTKAGELAYSTDDSFGTYSWWTENAWASTADANKLDYVFMTNEKVSWSATDTEWEPENAYYWTKTGKLHFVSYSPYKETSPMTYSVANGCQFANYQIPSTPEDLMYSTIALNKAKNETTYLKNTGMTEGVPTLFHHTLCKVSFKFVQKDETPLPSTIESVSIKVKSASIESIYTKASFKELPTAAWTSQSEASNFTLGTSDLTLTTTAQQYGSTRIHMPQTLAADGQKIKLTYDITIKYASNATAKTTTVTNQEVVLKTASLPSWDINKNIVYTIEIGAFSDQPILFDPAVVNWDDASETIEINGQQNLS